MLSSNDTRFGKLEENNVISKSLGEKWRSEDYYKEFIDIVQNNYVVIPPYTNERLTRQCGLFLLVSCFNFSYTESIKTSTIEKGYKDLRDELKTAEVPCAIYVNKDGFSYDYRRLYYKDENNNMYYNKKGFEMLRKFQKEQKW